MRCAMEDPYNNLPDFAGDTTICRTCGKCCKGFSHYIPSQEAWRIFNLSATLNITKEDLGGGGWTRIVYHYPCQYLLTEVKKGKYQYTCKIHDEITRPALCKHYPQSFLDLIMTDPNDEGLKTEALTCPIIKRALRRRKYEIRHHKT